MHGTAAPPKDAPLTVNQVLVKELSELRPAWLQGFAPAAADADAAARAANMRELYQRLHADEQAMVLSQAQHQGPLSALCLSGGGIRSATFNLGILQSLAKRELLGQFDYLSSVSGGGYIASWLRTWMRRAGSAQVLQQLRHFEPEHPLTPEPAEVRALREYSNYLTPQLGLFSGDTWAAATMVVRNIILNWLVIVPLIAAVTALPLLFLLIVKGAGSRGLGAPLLQAALLVELVASILVYWFRRFNKTDADVMKVGGTHQAVYIACCALPIFLAAALLAWAGVETDIPWLQQDPYASAAETQQLLVFCCIWCVVVPLLGWSVAEIAAWFKKVEVQRPRGAEFCGLGLAGLIAAGLLMLAVTHLLGPVSAQPALFVTLAAPLLLGIYLLARALFVAIADALAPCGARGDADREWWARLSGWLLLLIVFWLAGTTVCFLGAYLLESFPTIREYIMAATGGMAGLTGTLGALLANREKQPGTAPPSQGKKLTMQVATWLFVVAAIVLVAWLTIWLGELATGEQQYLNVSSNWPPPTLLEAVIMGGLSIGFFLLAFLTGLIVNVNRFSLHGMYRNRLIRAYLGASNIGRVPDPFTGFANDDNLYMADLWQPGHASYPLPIINTTLNLTHGEALAWQQRKGQSFAITPFHCGNFVNGYRRTEDYGGPKGVSVGTAVAISGAAANPEMGQNSSPAMGFLMTLFNVRLGAWLGNTNARGNKTYRRPGPLQALRPLLTELFGLANADGRYVNLSDGGHFDNLGLYEVVLRRCRYVFISDAGQDDQFTFEDLGNAIRKVRIDFGISVQFLKEIRILPRSSPGSDSKTGFYCATALIHYGEVDPGALPGKLVYIKPTICGAHPVPYDVYSYARASQMFPHEPTADQWFSESQFESYRALGRHIFEQLRGNGTRLSDFIDDLHARLDEIAARAGQEAGQESAPLQRCT